MKNSRDCNDTKEYEDDMMEHMYQMSMMYPMCPMMQPMYQMPMASNPMMYPTSMANQMPMMHQMPAHLMRKIKPLVQYGLKEAKETSTRHAMTEVALIAYLMGRGYNMHTAHRMVESWEIDEMFAGE